MNKVAGKKREKKEKNEKKKEDVESQGEPEVSDSEVSLGAAEEEEVLQVNDEGDYTPAKVVPEEGSAPTRHSLRKREKKPVVEDEMDDE